VIVVVRTAQDAETMSDLATMLLAYTYEHGWQNDPSHLDEIEHLPAEYAEPRGLTAVAYGGEMPAGCAVVRPMEDDTVGSYAEMRRLYVRPELRRRGVARRLVAELDQRAGALGYPRMRLVSLGDMTGAHELYRALGFVDIDQYRPTTAPEPVFMEKLLAR